MKKTLTLLFILCCLFFRSYGNHITGGTIFYELVSVNGNSYTYKITLALYRDSTSTGAQLDGVASISIFDKGTNQSVWNNGSVPLKLPIIALSLRSPNPCINNPPVIKYQVGLYEVTVTLPGSVSGYIIAYQRCCRISGINNLIGSNNVGATYTAEIPGTSRIITAPANNSARFVGSDTVVVCAGNSFCYDFGATDADTTDVLRYSFCNAYIGGGTAQGPGGGQNTAAPNPPAPPPYSSVPYAASFSADKPLGDNITLDPNTGMLCGIAPPAGIYVVTVCVTEFRNGVAIATQRKDLQIKVGDCDVVKAILPSSYPICDDFTRTFSNLAPPNTLITSYFWDFGDGFSSTNATPTHTFADTGTYMIKLVVNRNDPCGDSIITPANVYPGFFPNFNFSGVCVSKPTNFFDSTRTVYGVVNGWRWDFGDASTISDTSRLQNPVYTYTQTGPKPVQFIVTSSKGCIDTVFKDVPIIDKPAITVLPKDTLICNGDNVQLSAVGNGLFSWTPGTNIINANTATPTVSPTVTTKYIAQINDNGCINYDTVQVRVVDFVTLQAMADTVICTTDTMRLRANTNGLRFTWSPSASLNDPTLLSPRALPTTTTTYQIRATIGSCVATDDVQVTLVPYPVSNAGPDTTICFSTFAQLHANIVGSSFTWTPSGSLSNPSILDPIARPAFTTSYVLTVRDNIGCPKPKLDTVVVKVLPKVNAFAGRDTAVVVGQPLQFNAEGGVDYVWNPNTGLNDPLISNPVGLYDGSQDTIRYHVLVRDAAGCTDSAHVMVRIFKTNPQIFVPTAFTPNGDGRNDVFRPIAVGVTKIEYFRVFNRWGQLVFSTTQNEHGWDGKIGGREQGSGTFVWVVRGVDFTGKVVFAKGTVTLIR
jgi:gliding motility-associated-like protein